jgi:hypothetical protein
VGGARHRWQQEGPAEAIAIDPLPTPSRPDLDLFGRSLAPEREGVVPLDGRGGGALAGVLDAARRYVVSSTLQDVDWNAEPVRGDLAGAVGRLKDELADDLATGGVDLPTALAMLGLIDEYQFVALLRTLCGLTEPRRSITAGQSTILCLTRRCRTSRPAGRTGPPRREARRRGPPERSRSP